MIRGVSTLAEEQAGHGKEQAVHERKDEQAAVDGALLQASFLLPICLHLTTT